MGGFGKEKQEERIICIHIAESQVVLMVKNLPANAGNIRVQSLGQKNPVEEEMETTPVSLPGESHGQRRLAVHGVEKNWT